MRQKQEPNKKELRLRRQRPKELDLRKKMLELQKKKEFAKKKWKLSVFD